MAFSLFLQCVCVLPLPRVTNIFILWSTTSTFLLPSLSHLKTMFQDITHPHVLCTLICIVFPPEVRCDPLNWCHCLPMIATYNLNGIDLYKIVVPQILRNHSKVTEVIFLLVCVRSVVQGFLDRGWLLVTETMRKGDCCSVNCSHLAVPPQDLFFITRSWYLLTIFVHLPHPLPLTTTICSVSINSF